jgi:hypothetical protein
MAGHTGRFARESIDSDGLGRDGRCCTRRGSRVRRRAWSSSPAPTAPRPSSSASPPRYPPTPSPCSSSTLCHGLSTARYRGPLRVTNPLRGLVGPWRLGPPGRKPMARGPEPVRCGRCSSFGRVAGGRQGRRAGIDALCCGRAPRPAAAVWSTGSIISCARFDCWQGPPPPCPSSVRRSAGLDLGPAARLHMGPVARLNLGPAGRFVCAPRGRVAWRCAALGAVPAVVGGESV